MDQSKVERVLTNTVKDFKTDRKVRAFAKTILYTIDPMEDWDEVIFGGKARAYPIDEMPEPNRRVEQGT